MCACGVESSGFLGFPGQIICALGSICFSQVPRRRFCSTSLDPWSVQGTWTFLFEVESEMFVGAGVSRRFYFKPKYGPLIVSAVIVNSNTTFSLGCNPETVCPFISIKCYW